ncbi:Cd(II)/Pb(II)-responsive transcriptional regulator [Polaromonas sp. C04]|uniref:Cd(II)/Pb(II)-responsive transcriptional regulator n=1 Tax=Polaromonas sp. C04 TaxID=1945857 RepID=UPI000986DB35|nr:Cd(II)/Pb(II)-responsive transcriptional regulator [Polaromonas sp. C04]OOG51688.1 Cd(II)/Pb(II)-responsive transcriptional regulator [Polaromonas sp. C04]
MKIGELARATLTPLETIRFYEREGLLPDAGRTDGNYRIYGQQHVERLTFIRHCRTLDMALGEIRALLRFKASPQENCAAVNELLDDHIGHVAQRIRELRALEKQLKVLRQQCSEANAAADCGILKGLSGVMVADRSPPKSRKHVQGTH